MTSSTDVSSTAAAHACVQPDGLVLVIEGSAIIDIASFYDEINRVFMADEDWQLGPSLDALDDLLYGGHGALAGHATATVLWKDIACSRAALAGEATRGWLLAKRERTAVFHQGTINAQLQALDRGDGQTYFDIVLHIFATHPRIRLLEG